MFITWRKFMSADAGNGGGALTAEGLVLKSLEGMNSNISEIKKEVAGRMAKEDFDKSITELKSQMAQDAAKYESFTNEQKAAFDQLKGVVETIEKKGGMFNASNTKVPNFKSAYSEAIMEKKADLARMAKENTSVTLEIKADVMTTSNSLTGDGVISYNVKQALIPGQKVNFRNLIPSTISPTREYVTFKEGTTVGTPDWQVEGEEKATIEYNFSNVQLLNEYLAGVVTFSKQLMKSLPWLQGTLPRLLFRDFYKKENAEFYADAVAAGTTYVASGITDDVQATIAAIGQMASTDFSPSFGVVNPTQWARLAIGTYSAGYYAGSGAVMIENTGAITIAGVPIIPASWVADDKLLLIDADYVERVEAESVNVTFSFEHNNNFTKNLVTAKIECMEVLNVMLPGAVLVMDYGNAT